MRRMPNNKNFQFQLTVIFWIIVCADIIGIATEFLTLHFIAKPLLIPVLITRLVFAKIPAPHKNLLLAGLFFSWLGDMFLLFEYRNKIFFILV